MKEENSLEELNMSRNERIFNRKPLKVRYSCTDTVLLTDTKTIIKKK